MPFCPKCRYEYNPEITKCPDCDEPMVEVLPEETEINPNLPEEYREYKDWVQLARINSQPYAEMLLEALQSKEIPSVILSGAGHFGITGQMGATSYRAVGGGYSLMVPIDFIKKADKEGAEIFEDWEEMKLVDIE